MMILSKLLRKLAYGYGENVLDILFERIRISIWTSIRAGIAPLRNILPTDSGIADNLRPTARGR